MYKIKLFQTFNSNNLKSLENLMFLIWLQYLIFDQYQNLHLLDSELFYPRGVFRFFNLLKINLVLNQYFVLITLKICIGSENFPDPNSPHAISPISGPIIL